MLCMMKLIGTHLFIIGHLSPLEIFLANYLETGVRGGMKVVRIYCPECAYGFYI